MCIPFLYDDRFVYLYFRFIDEEEEDLPRWEERRRTITKKAQTHMQKKKQKTHSLLFSS